MTPIMAGYGILGAVALSGALVGVFAEDRTSRGAAIAERTAGAAVRESLPSCGEGPARLSDMSSQGGFLRARAEGSPNPREFYFARAMYSEDGSNSGRWGNRDSGLGDGGPRWSTDYPWADRHMMMVASRLINLNACEWERPVSLADPELRRFPFLYALEMGDAVLTEPEVEGLRDYLEAGGLLMIDDFWGTYEWRTFEREIGRVLPGREIVEIPRDHILFRAYYVVEGDILQVPNVRNGRDVAMGYPRAQTWEGDGVDPHVRGIFDDDGHLMVVIYWNTDLGDALEWAEDQYYPVKYSTFAANLFLNTIVYAMTQ